MTWALHFARQRPRNGSALDFGAVAQDYVRTKLLTLQVGSMEIAGPVEVGMANSRRGLVVVDFWAPGAGPALRQREMLTVLVRDAGGHLLLTTENLDQEPALASAYGINSIPPLFPIQLERTTDAQQVLAALTNAAQDTPARCPV